MTDKERELIGCFQRLTLENQDNLLAQARVTLMTETSVKTSMLRAIQSANQEDSVKPFSEVALV
jgi:hypothetical protein